MVIKIIEAFPKASRGGGLGQKVKGRKIAYWIRKTSGACIRL